MSSLFPLGPRIFVSPKDCSSTVYRVGPGLVVFFEGGGAMNIFFLEYLALFLILAAAGYKVLKVFRAGRRDGEPREGRQLENRCDNIHPSGL